MRIEFFKDELLVVLVFAMIILILFIFFVILHIIGSSFKGIRMLELLLKIMNYLLCLTVKILGITSEDLNIDVDYYCFFIDLIAI